MSTYSDNAEPPADGGSQGPSGANQSPALQSRLLRASQLATIGEMAAGVAHELNQPLTAIVAYAQACARIVKDPHAQAQLQEALQEITLQAERAAEIIRRLRGLARSPQSTRARVQINALVEEVLGLLQADARHHHVRLELDLAAALPAVLADGGQIQQVILNFARNSLEALSSHSRGTGELLIRSSLTAAGDVELAVIDNGPGLNPETMQRLFDPFFSTKEQGTGLGLAMSHTIARAHGGRVGYRPHHPSGACFYLCLPPAD